MLRLLTHTVSLVLMFLCLLSCTPASREWIDWELTKGFHELNTRPSTHCYTNTYRVKGGYTSSTHCY